MALARESSAEFSIVIAKHSKLALTLSVGAALDVDEDVRLLACRLDAHATLEMRQFAIRFCYSFQTFSESACGCRIRMLASCRVRRL